MRSACHNEWMLFNEMKMGGCLNPTITQSWAQQLLQAVESVGALDFQGKLFEFELIVGVTTLFALMFCRTILVNMQNLYGSSNARFSISHSIRVSLAVEFSLHRYSQPGSHNLQYNLRSLSPTSKIEMAPAAVEQNLWKFHRNRPIYLDILVAAVQKFEFSAGTARYFNTSGTGRYFKK